MVKAKRESQRKTFQKHLDKAQDPRLDRTGQAEILQASPNSPQRVKDRQQTPYGFDLPKMTIDLPEYGYENNLVEFLERLSGGKEADEIVINFQHVRFLTPGALVLLLAVVKHWVCNEKDVGFSNCKQCPAFRYLQRIDFFSICNIKLSEDFERKDPKREFMELKPIGVGVDVATLSSNIAYCVFPDAEIEDDPDKSGLFDILQYAISELANNVTQHSKSSGFATAQYTGSDDLVRVGIADDGIGVRASFEQTGSPHFLPSLNDSAAIDLATQPKVSSKGHLSTPWGESINAGVGLTLLKQVSFLTGGSFFMASGCGVCYQYKGDSNMTKIELPIHFHGTVCALSFQRSKVKNFADLLFEAKESVGLLQSNINLDKFFL